MKNTFLWVRLWLNYLACWPGMFPIGNPKDAGVLFAQSFGRNDIPDAILFIVRQIWESTGRNDQATIKKLRENHVDPGEPNRSLAKEMMAIMEQYGIPAITQWEVALALPCEWYQAHAQDIIVLWPPKSGYFSTREVKLLTAKIMRERGFCTPIELAHGWMATRATLIVANILGKLPIVLPQKTYCFDPDSVQPWTRGKLAWLFREVITRIHHIIYRWVW